MANKFQKSVLERLEAEEKRRKAADKPQALPAEKIAAAEEPASPVAIAEDVAEFPVAEAENTEAPASTPTEQENTADLSSASIAEAGTAVPHISPDIRAYIRRDAQRAAKNKTFYLDGAVVDAVKRVAREHEVTESRLVNDILRGVFGLEPD